MTSDSLTYICVALLGVLVFVLGANATRHRVLRGATGDHLPTDPRDRLFIAQRAHGNATEYAPSLAVLLVLGSALTDGWWVAILGVVAVAVRLLHATGMLRSSTLASHGPLRDVGAIGTYLTGITLGVTVLVAAL